MSTISSKQRKRHGLVDPVLVFLVMILALVVFAPFPGITYDSFSRVLPPFGNASDSWSLKSELSFAADRQYWDVNCGSGWSQDAMCQEITLRTQSCSISTDSAYCSEYATYMKQYLKK